jgi:hypothetical protein
MPDFLAAHPKVDVLLRLEDRYMDLIDDQVTWPSVSPTSRRLA